MSAKRRRGTQGGRGSDSRPGGCSENTHSAPQNLRRRGRSPGSTLVLGLADHDWNFAAVPEGDFESAAKFEYFRESKTLVDMAFYKKERGKGFGGVPRAPHTLEGLWGYLPNRCDNWNLFEKKPRVLASPWLDQPDEIKNELRRLWKTHPCKIMSWHDLDEARSAVVPGTGGHWPDTHVGGDERLTWLRDAMAKNPALRFRRGNREVLAFEVDWNRFDETQIADEIRRQFLAVYGRPIDLPDLSQKPEKFELSLRHIAVARLRKVGFRDESNITALAKSAGYSVLAQMQNGAYRNYRRDILNDFYRFHPYLRRHTITVQAEGEHAPAFRWPEKDELPWCLSSDELRPMVRTK